MHLLSLQPWVRGGWGRLRERRGKGCGERVWGWRWKGGGYVEEQKSKTVADWFHPSILGLNNPWFLERGEGGGANKQSQPRSRAALQYPWAASTSLVLLKQPYQHFSTCLSKGNRDLGVNEWLLNNDWLGKMCKGRESKRERKGLFRSIKYEHVVCVLLIVLFPPEAFKRTYLNKVKTMTKTWLTGTQGVKQRTFYGTLVFNTRGGKAEGCSHTENTDTNPCKIPTGG